jgi:hypothetical protein
MNRPGMTLLLPIIFLLDISWRHVTDWLEQSPDIELVDGFERCTLDGDLRFTPVATRSVVPECDSDVPASDGYRGGKVRERRRGGALTALEGLTLAALAMLRRALSTQRGVSILRRRHRATLHA